MLVFQCKDVHTGMNVGPVKDPVGPVWDPAGLVRDPLSKKHCWFGCKFTLHTVQRANADATRKMHGLFFGIFGIENLFVIHCLCCNVL